MTKNGSMKMSGGGNKSQGLPATTNKKTGSLIRHIMKEAYSNPKQRSGGSQEQDQQKTPSFSYEVSNLSVSLKSGIFGSFGPEPPTPPQTFQTLSTSGTVSASSLSSYISSSAFLYGLLRLVFEFTIDKDLTKSNGGKIKIDVSKADGTPREFFGDINNPGGPPISAGLKAILDTLPPPSWKFYFKDGTGVDISDYLEISLENIVDDDGDLYNEASTLVIQLKSSANINIGKGNCTFILSFNENDNATSSGRYLGQGPYQFFVNEQAEPGYYDFSISSATNKPSAGFTVTS